MLARRARRVACALMALAVTTLVLAGPTAIAQEPTPPEAPAVPETPAAPVTLTKVAGPGLAEQFPVGSFMVMRTREIERHVKWMSDGPLGRLVMDPEVKPLWDLPAPRPWASCSRSIVDPAPIASSRTWTRC